MIRSRLAWLLVPLLLVRCTSTPTSADVEAVTSQRVAESLTAGSTSSTVDVAMQATGSAPTIVKIDATSAQLVRLVAVPTNTAVVQVDFYRGADLSRIGSTRASPYVLQAQVVAAGSRTILAIGRDAMGAALEYWVTTFDVTVAAQPPPPPPGPLSSLPLIQPGTLVYQGGFRLSSGFARATPSLAWSAERKTLFISNIKRVNEVAIPLLHRGPVMGMETAVQLQAWTEPTDGRWGSINPTDPNDKNIGGLLADRGRLVSAWYAFYDANATQVLSHFTRPLDLSLSDVEGPFQVGTPPIVAGYVSGYMGTVPQAWQALIGGTALTGNCCLPILSRTSWGPAIVSFDPADLGTAPAPAHGLVYYPQTHPTLGGSTSTGARFNGTATGTGIVFPEGTRSVLVWGRIGVGKADYGSGTVNKALDQMPVPGSNGNDHYVWDPTNQDKGYHAYPYEYRVWAYDALDLVAVKEGKKQPWEVAPYAVWKPDFGGLSNPGALTGGVAYDAATGRIFVAVRYLDTDVPIVAVFTLAGLTAQAMPTPTLLEWDIDAASLSEAQALAYRLVVDAMPLDPLPTTCTGVVAPFVCSTPMPALSLAVTATDGGGTPEQSESLKVRMLAP